MNRLKVNRHSHATAFIDAIHSRHCSVEVSNNLLSPAEMASFLHYPDASVAYVHRLRSKKMPVPEGILVFDSYDEAKAAGAIVFGYTAFRGKFKYVAFSDLKMLMQHCYIIGATGSGKTTLLQMLVLEIIDQCGVTFFDVKGDAVKKLMKFLPPKYEHRLNYVDLSDDDYYIPLNILKIPGLDIYDLATLLVTVFVTVFGEQSIQFKSQNTLRQALLGVLATDKEGSILEVYRMFTDENYLDLTIERLEKLDDFPDVLAYWKKYKDMKPTKRAGEHDAILNKLQLITQNKRPRYTLCQKQNALDMRKLIDSKALNLVNLDMGKNDAMIQRFFGTVITALLRKAFYSRSDIPEEKRVPHVFILDEFEKFTKQDEDFKDLLALVRSYGGGLILTHQSVEQLTQSMLALITDNTFTQIALNVGDGSGRAVANMFPGFVSDDLTSLVPHQAVGRLKKLNPQPFTFETLDFTKIYTDFGEDYVTEMIRRTHKLRYRPLYAIKDEINQRYALTERNLVTDDDAVPVVKKKNASGKIERSKINDTDRGPQAEQVRTSEPGQSVATLQGSNRQKAIPHRKGQKDHPSSLPASMPDIGADRGNVL
jgi:DNA helicase HerA-like ATPase